MNEILERYKKEMAGHGISGARHFPVSRFFKGIHLKLPPETGRGWTEVLKIESGFCLSLSDYVLSKKTTDSSRYIHAPLQFNILLDGTFDFQFGSTISQKVCPGGNWDNPLYPNPFPQPNRFSLRS